MKKLGYLLICILCIAGCSKDDKGINDSSPPVIVAITPTNNQVFNAGQNVNISMHVTDDQKIFVVHVHISDKNTGQLLFDIHRYPDSGSYELNESFAAKASTDYKIQVIARDAGGNETTLDVSVSAS